MQHQSGNNVDKFCNAMGENTYNGGNIGINVNPNSELGKKITKYAQENNLPYSEATGEYLAKEFPGE